jgi:hypothetical protein
LIYLFHFFFKKKKEKADKLKNEETIAELKKSDVEKSKNHPCNETNTDYTSKGR